MGHAAGQEEALQGLEGECMAWVWGSGSRGPTCRKGFEADLEKRLKPDLKGWRRTGRVCEERKDRAGLWTL